MRLFDTILRAVLTAGYALIKDQTRSRPGVHAVALTPEHRIVFVKLRYARGWRLPGGGRHEGEEPTDAVLRELVEEIGMTAHGAMQMTQVGPDPILIVRDVRYRSPDWSWEVEQITEARLDNLPPDLAPITARWLTEIRQML